MHLVKWLKQVTWKQIVAFLAFQLVFGLLVGPWLVFRGPFEEVRSTALGTIGTTFHGYLITPFVGRGAIEKLLAARPDVKQSTAVNFVNRHDTSMTLQRIDGSGYQGFALIIKDPTTVQVLPAEGLPSQGETTSGIARRNHALAAINAGGFYDNRGQGTGGRPEGVIIHKGQILFNDMKSPDQKTDMIFLNDRGQLYVGRYSLNELIARRVREAVSFGPALVVDGKPTIHQGDGGWGIAPRTAIGQKADGSIIFLVIDGRQTQSIGATLRDVQDIMLKLGAVEAANLDGGSSTTLYYDGGVVNRPANLLGERHVPDVFAVMPQESGR